MKRFTIYVSLISLVAASTFLALSHYYSGVTLAGQGADKKEYVCPPCGCGADEAVSDKPGACGTCGMVLVVKGSEASRPMQEEPQPERKRVAILVFDGVQIIDYTGPYEVFGQAGFNVYTVATTGSPITTAMGMKVTPSHTLDDAPAANIIVIPGGGVIQTQNDPKVIKWIQDNSKQAEYVLSVCNGAFILAKTGLLDGLSATTFYGLIEGFTAFAPKTKVVTDRRYVDNGKIITTAGLSSGIDGSLYVISKILGKASAQMVALNMEYNWQPDSGYARASFADIHLRKIFNRGLRLDLPSTTSKVLSTEGGADSWEIKWQVASARPPAEVLKLVDDRLTSDGKWSRQAAAKAADTPSSAWRFTDEKGESWEAASVVRPVAGEKDSLLVSVKIARAGKKVAADARTSNK